MGKNDNKEVRSCAIEPIAKEDSRTIRGTALRFDEPSIPLSYGGKIFTEVISRSAITEEVLQRSDIKAYISHNTDRLLARSCRGAGSLTLELDDAGLHFEFDAPHTQTGDEALELIRRGDIRGCSFAFYNAEDKWEKREDGTYVRTITSIPCIDDVSIVVSPAYECTEVSVRGLERLNEEQKPQPEEKAEETTAEEQEPQPEEVSDAYYNELEAVI